MQSIKDSWNGSEKLWKVFWLYNIILGTFLTKMFDFLPEGNLGILIPAFLIVGVWGVWVMVSMWRCAFNAKWRGWGYIVRTLVVLGVIAIIANIALLFSGQELAVDSAG